MSLVTCSAAPAALFSAAVAIDAEATRSDALQDTNSVSSAFSHVKSLSLKTRSMIRLNPKPDRRATELLFCAGLPTRPILPRNG